MAKARKGQAPEHGVTEAQIAVAGAGPSGMAAAILFARHGFDTVLIAPPAAASDGRTTALLESSVEMLKALGLWEAIVPKAAPLAHMRIVDATDRLIRAPEVVFNASELKLPAFGYNIENRDLNAVLAEACGHEARLTRLESRVCDVSISGDRAILALDGGASVHAALVVGADGRRSRVREAAGIEVSEWRYPQSALVLNLDHRVPHRDHSTEFHTRTGPFTLVPLPGRRSSLVCVERPETVEELMALSDAALAVEIERRACSIYGAMTVSSTRQSFPLGGMTAKRVVADRVGLIGEAAHVFPPIGAQGLNLGLRDVAMLGEIVAEAKAHGRDIGAADVLARYERMRRPDILSRTAAVDLLNRSLLSDLLPVQAGRSFGLYLAGRVGPLRRFLMREGIAPMLARPRLMRGLPLA